MPKIPSMKIVDLARAISPKCRFKIINIRPGEKLHETLISEDEARKAKIFDGIYVVLPQFLEEQEVHRKYAECPPTQEGFTYRSDTNSDWLTLDDLKRIVE